MEERVNRAIDNFLENKTVKKISDTEVEECDLETGECFIIREKDGIVERINKKFITEDGRQLLGD